MLVGCAEAASGGAGGAEEPTRSGARGAGDSFAGALAGRARRSESAIRETTVRRRRSGTPRDFAGLGSEDWGGGAARTAGYDPVLPRLSGIVGALMHPTIEQPPFSSQQSAWCPAPHALQNAAGPPALSGNRQYGHVFPSSAVSTWRRVCEASSAAVCGGWARGSRACLLIGGLGA
jgi:hypothetical protein